MYMLVSLKQVFQKADRGGYAVGAFNVSDLEILQSVVAAAERMRSPVILQTTEGAIAYAGMDYLLAMMTLAAKKARVPVVAHLDHGKDSRTVRQAIASGYTSVMFDGSLRPFAKNVAMTRSLVALAHRCGVSVEAELGPIPGLEDSVKVSEKQAYYTDPAQAAKFVRATRCDALAVAVGTAHGPYKSYGTHRTSLKLDTDRIKKIKTATGVPLVLHGASGVPKKLMSRLHRDCASLGDCARVAHPQGVPDDQIRAAIRAGICKINVDTDLRIAWTAAVRETILDDRSIYDPRKILGPAKKLIQEVVESKMKLFGSTGKT